MLEAYRQHVEERAAVGVPPRPLSPEQVGGIVELLKNPPSGEEQTLIDLITHRVPPGVDEAAYVKAGFLSTIVTGETTCPIIDKKHAIELLGNMHGGYNITTLVNALEDTDLAELAAEQLKHTLLMFDAFHDVAEKAKAGNTYAKSVLQSWADDEWFTRAENIRLVIPTFIQSEAVAVLLPNLQCLRSTFLDMLSTDTPALSAAVLQVKPQGTCFSIRAPPPQPCIT